MATLAVIVALTLCTSSFCSLCEAALYSVSRVQVERLAESGSAQGRRLRALRQEISRPIAAILTLNTISNTVGATLAGMVAGEVFDSVGLGVFGAAFTLGILYISEIIPKTVGVLYADTLAPRLAGVIQGTIWVLWPLVWVSQKVSALFPKSSGSGSEASEEDILVLARLGLRAGALRPDEARWMENALKLDRLKVSDILTPRTVVLSLPRDTRLSEALRIVSGWPFSRVPVTDGPELDRVVGIAMRQDVYERLIAGKGDETIGGLMRAPTFVPETMRVSDLLEKFLRVREHLFLVADEYGGVTGVVALEDAIEALLGSEIIDETDRHVDMQRVARRNAAEKLARIQDMKSKDTGDRKSDPESISPPE